MHLHPAHNLVVRTVYIGVRRTHSPYMDSTAVNHERRPWPQGSLQREHWSYRVGFTLFGCVLTSLEPLLAINRTSRTVWEEDSQGLGRFDDDSDNGIRHTRCEDLSSKIVGGVPFSNFGPFWAISPKWDPKSKFHSFIFWAFGRSMIPKEMKILCPKL